MRTRNRSPILLLLGVLAGAGCESQASWTMPPLAGGPDLSAAVVMGRPVGRAQAQPRDEVPSEPAVARDDDVQAVVPEGTAPPARIPAEIFAAAVDSYVSGQRLDMQALARRANVGRATLYRRAGNREQLLDEVIWWRARRMLAARVRATRGYRTLGRASGSMRRWDGRPI